MGAAGGLRTRLTIANRLLCRGHGVGQSLRQCDSFQVFLRHISQPQQGAEAQRPFLQMSRARSLGAPAPVSPFLSPVLAGAGPVVPGVCTLG